MRHTLVVNLNKGYRRAELEGRPHLVVDAVIMVDDVVANGSEGAFLYPSELNKRKVKDWNGVPIVVYHPKKGKKFASARTAAAYNSQKVGVVLNSAHDGKLKVEAWFDEERTKKIDKRVYNNILNAVPTEVSTGLEEVEFDPTAGEMNGERYNGVIVNYLADHLAVLPDQKGACSLAMGAGLFANELHEEFVGNRDFSADKRKDLAKTGAALPDGSYPIETVEDLHNAIQAFGRAKDPEAVKRHIIKRARALGATKSLPADWKVTVANTGEMVPLEEIPEGVGLVLARSAEERLSLIGGEMVGNQMSFGTIQSQLSSLLAAEYGEKGRYWDGYVCEVYDDFAIFVQPGANYSSSQYMMQKYTASDSGVALSGKAVPVTKSVQYKTADGKAVMNEAASQPQQESTQMAFDKTAHVNGLIANGSFPEADREWLMGLTDDRLQRLKPPAPAASPPPPPAPAQTVANQQTEVKKTVVNLEDLSPELQKTVKRGLQAEQRQKDGYIEKITAHPKNKYTKEALANMDLDDLAAIAELATPVEPEGDGRFVGGWRPDYAANGQTRETVVANAAKDLDEPLTDLPD